MKLNPRSFGMAAGCAAAIFYLGCMLLMHFASPEALVTFFNSLLHGLDIEPILRTEVGWALSLFGLINTFVLAWLFGALMAMIYNLASSPRKRSPV